MEPYVRSAIRLHGMHSRLGGGGAAPNTNLSAPARNLQNIKYIHADQPAKTRATPYRIHVLPLLTAMV